MQGSRRLEGREVEAASACGLQPKDHDLLLQLLGRGGERCRREGRGGWVGEGGAGQSREKGELRRNEEGGEEGE